MSDKLQSMVKRLSTYNYFDKNPDAPYLYNIYRGINHRYYQKWLGFDKLSKGADEEEVDKEVIDFYLSYFYYALKLDVLNDFQLQYLIFNFAVQNGKKKAISKIQKALNLDITGYASIKLMEAINFLHSSKVINNILLEFIEFYDFTGKLNQASWLLDFYRHYK